MSDDVALENGEPGYKSLKCYIRGERNGSEANQNRGNPGHLQNCPSGTKCLMTIVQKYGTSGLQYYASCEPENDDYCSAEGCERNAELPYLDQTIHAKVCVWCCNSNKCNDIRNCIDTKCLFSSPLHHHPENSYSYDGAKNTLLSLVSFVVSLVASFHAL
ncbi:hypothetical protein LSH36_963g00038 [Paralvinella palmiformis]|uniref:Uncharacterized protein n=1 Tax=Paralvinella palmiformis TaxID=53620 RepID=A0AAD9IWR4_9ANNE|nr:hypothetical protein LSH36_963g00038 [Paralvinella palmiformis]